MRRAAFVVGFLLTCRLAAGQNNCLECHREIEDEELAAPALAMTDDVHFQAGLSCVDCHGGDASVEIVDYDYDPAKAPGTGFVGKPEPDDIPALCGGCHSDATYMHRFDPNISVDQLAQYWTSTHGERLREGVNDVAQCASCHLAHGVLSSEDPRAPVYPTRIPDTCGACHADAERMAPYSLPTDQLAQYRRSVHGKALFEGGDLGAPTCNSCHGNHGAAPPGLSSVSLVCGTCHGIQKQLFSDSPHQEAFEALDEPECEVCHGNHEVLPPTDDMVGTGEESVCLECHYEDESAYRVAATMRRKLEELKGAMASARDVVRTASRAGMEVSEAELALIDANEALVQSRNLVHAFATEPLEEKVGEGLDIAAEAEDLGHEALAELDYRRKGLAASVFFILLVVIGLHLKIRQIEKRE